ncbi:AraC family transcriptional regulator [Arenimonas caeni]|jgi:AraC-like DNA-binding protein|uniref:AraC family transcriptional regulator n=1 Tax=Arenimonas caeni TaxID=2058085 RepID=UPI002A361AFF|nr:AraC family transcriptional regulator [Arenimonas caeni]MDY0021488.1 AraC family transcriptional regulator [Arenimonas caeni]
MAVDRLQGLLSRFSVSARMFHSGPLCGITDIDDNGLGQLHLVRRGPLEVRHAGEVVRVDEPSLLFYPRPLAHRFISDDLAGADMACANLAFGSGASVALRTDAHHPIARSLPPFLCLPLAALPGAAPVLDLLFDEAFALRCGRQVLVDRLFDAVLVLLLRHLLDSGHIKDGPLAGLGHPQLAKALVAMHDEPASPWTLETLAARAGMSRSRFAEVFAQVVGETPAAYLAQYRITLAKDALLRGEGLERIAQQVGYGSAAALSRAFSGACGVSPREWRAQ